MCDLNKDGTVERSEVLQIALQINAMMMQLGFSMETYGSAEVTVEKRVQKVFCCY